MKKSILINMNNYDIELITNGKEEFDNIVLCFHGFNGDKWGDSYSGLKKKLENSLVCSFDSCGHGDSFVKAEDMRLDCILSEIDKVVSFFKSGFPNKPIVFVAVSYGGYRVMEYLIKYKPQIDKVVYINPAFRFLEILEFAKEFKYSEIRENELVPMKRSLNKFMSKKYLDDLFKNNLYRQKLDINYDSEIVIGTKDRLIPREDTLEISEMYGYKITYVDDDHCLEKEDSWNVVADIIKGVK